MDGRTAAMYVVTAVVWATVLAATVIASLIRA